MGKLIATDLDGTLFYPKKRVRMISSKSLKFIRNHIDNGGRLVLVSGRNEEFSKKVVKKIDRPVDVIGCNASFIKVGDKMISETKFDVKKVNDMLDKLIDDVHPMAYFIMDDKDNFVCRDKFKSLFYKVGYALWVSTQGVYRERFKTSREKFYECLNDGNARKIMVFFGIGKKNKNRAKEANKIIREKYKDVVEASWSGEFIELSPYGCSKSLGLKYYINYLNINPSDVYVVGDSGNDISMFNEFPEHSFCMKRSPLSVSKYAKYTISRFQELEKYIK